MNLQEMKGAFFDSARSIEILQNNQNMLVEAINKEEPGEKKDEPEKKPGQT